MRTILPAIVSALVLSVLAFLTRYLLRVVNRRIWRNRLLDITARYFPYFIFLVWGILLISFIFKLERQIPVLFTILGLAMFGSLILILTLPFSYLAELISRKVSGLKKRQSRPNPERRRFLKTAAAAIPVFTLTATSSGFTQAFNRVRRPQVELHFRNLPAELDGLRIGHLSDLHLGYYFNLPDLEALLTDMESDPPDMVLITGDVADDLRQLPDALRLIGQLPTALPKFASVGNHEYFRGLAEVRRQFDAGPIPLLLNEGSNVKIGQIDLFIGGADDPVSLGRETLEFMQTTAEKAMKQSPASAFKILMSHRPRALDIAGKFDVNLVLAGHTHGGQIGLNGRSVFEDMMKERYLWGKYAKDEAQLYTSSGVGHWFPYRLGCPAEAPVIVLKQDVKS